MLQAQTVDFAILKLWELTQGNEIIRKNGLRATIFQLFGLSPPAMDSQGHCFCQWLEQCFIVIYVSFICY